MLCVTITIVYSLLSFSIRSSMRAVAIGSSAEHGSSIRITSGLDRDRARDAQALLLAPRQAERALLELVLDLVPQRRVLERLLDEVAEVAAAVAVDPRSVGDVVVDRLRERVRLLEDHPDPPADLGDIDLRASRGPRRGTVMLPLTRAPGVRSCMRFRARSTVVLPHPEGPMNAVISLAATSRLTSRTAVTPL